ncbi:copper chaperone PCu(A)C [Microbacterium maritypicum]|uniref:copper chaperone PCu(A)C n=1 Tax=Microbacterium TaxID=33882 RepID=UPI0004930C27|nr:MULTISPECIES: copper chaperone PCu(A)C [Microbacterium]MCV0333738.1 copper chaperone PCu(A)C [Microbacterium sp.]MCV0375017.1 copper chaperone PCu(A)C [Microbacterium sp.]MCV0388463.1 copper chaperone PCu(A)C [Microbacterium sp.]MCV0416990.1 copper chaperone PCu(A)C [Microbacterium sp.]MCV0420301.1 copper chaperone PCu(A)C [Microbacterium sp.]
MNTSKNLPRLAAVIAVSLLALTGCTPESSPTESASRPAGDAVTIEDAWVKSAEEGMSAGFGTLVNSGDDDVTVVSVTSEASNMLELHETVENEAGEMVMREKDGGFVIPAGGKLALEPGGNHIMMMDLTGPLTAGSDVTFTLTFSDDSTYEFTAPVKDYSGANENYEGGEEQDGSGQ